MTNCLTELETKNLIQEAEDKVAEFNNTHLGFCEVFGGFPCDCGLEDAEKWVTHLKNCVKNKMPIRRTID